MVKKNDVLIKILFVLIIIIFFSLIIYCACKDYYKCEVDDEKIIPQARNIVINTDDIDKEMYGTVTVYDPYGKLFSCVGNISIINDKDNKSQVDIIVTLP